ncbi:hypothetical protein BJV77DRAFT_1142104 [Russula vinacea]|nr:hypothetical protein BJV77DRAFT_1142104 [Russula vinacea]
MSNLDGFVTHKLPLPEPLATSAEIQDRQSTFLAYVFRASTPEQARRAHSHVRRVIHAKNTASHEIMAWRCMVLKEDRRRCEDDGELRAGGHILRVMRSEAIMDAVVIVSRWYGGIMLGPVRFTHIQDCARNVCQVFKVEDEMQDCISMLQRFEGGSKIAPHQGLLPLQKSLDIAKARRQISAREKAIESVKKLINEEQAPPSAHAPVS